MVQQKFAAFIGVFPRISTDKGGQADADAFRDERHLFSVAWSLPFCTASPAA